MKLRAVYVLCGLIAVVTCGCGDPDRAQVSGRVVRTDGTPVVGARVIFRSPATGKCANGLTNDIGEYSLGVMKKGDGIPSGEYVVTVVEDLGNWENPKPATIHPNYRHPDRSGLKATLTPGTSLTYDLELKLPPGK